MSRLQYQDHTARLISTSGTWGEAEIVASDRGVLVSLTGKNYDTEGRPHSSNALANLSPADARRLSALLLEATAAAEDVNPRRAALWSEATFTVPLSPRGYRRRLA